MKNYTYCTFATDVIAMLNGENTVGTKEVMLTKAAALLAANQNKAAYNSTHKKQSTAKGASDATKAIVAELERVLSSEPLTAADINAKLGTDYTALRISGAVKFMDRVEKVKVIRSTVNSKGLKADKEFTAYKRID